MVVLFNYPALTLSFFARALGSVILIGLVRFFIRLYQVRRNVREIASKYGIPLMPHSFLFGHLLTVGKVVARYPAGTASLGAALLLAKEYPELGESGVIYMDTWPFAGPTMAVFHPDMMAQFTQETSLPKGHFMRHELYPLTQCKDLVTSEGEEWKTWRSIFNPGFSAKNLTSLLPAFLEEIQVIRERFTKFAESGEIVQLEPVVQKGTVDVICRAVLGIRLHCQSRDDEPFTKALQDQISWLVYDNMPSSLLRLYNPLRPFAIWRNDRIMRKFLTPHLERGFAEYASTGGALTGPKTINYLAIKSYMTEVQSTSGKGMPLQIDPQFIDRAISHFKIFMFAGHDTTASTLSFAYNLLFTNPLTLAITRAEHDAVLGTDPADAMARLSADPQLLNRMPYSAAVVRETLRLFPVAATARQGSKDFFLTNPDTGKRYPTGGFIVWGASFAVHRLEAYWERPDEFLPERWLAREGEPLHVRKNAFRPFELGPRNCIGQELAQLEMRAILAMTLREFDIESAYPEDAPTFLGEKAYQVMLPGHITGHVKDGFPIRVKLRKHQGA